MDTTWLANRAPRGSEDIDAHVRVEEYQLDITRHQRQECRGKVVMSGFSRIEMSHRCAPGLWDARCGDGPAKSDDHHDDARSRPHQDDAGVVVAPSCQPDFLQFGLQQRLVRQPGLILGDERRTGRSAEGVFPLPHHPGVGHSMKPRAFWLMRWPRAPRSVK